jgi:predicted kinase
MQGYPATVEAVIFTGIQASGKSAFYKERFFHSHVRISLDLLRTRHREAVLLKTCLELRQPFVVDNTNPAATDRARYIALAR